MIRNAAIASIALLSTCLSSTALADNPQGACCWPDPDLGMVCQLMNVQACNQAGGYFYGNGTSCQDPFVECDAPLGACCVEDGDIGLVCYALTAADCADVAGYFYGAGTLCTDPLVECVPANEDGACCFEDANGWQCVELEAYKCQDLAGTWYGAGVLCSSPQIVCPPEEPIGACCADEDGDGQYWCAQLTLIDCSASNGYWYGPGVLCSDPIVECETQDDPRGACCIFDDAANQYWCSQQTLIDCSASNGYWYGPGVLCSDPIVECETQDDPRGACCIFDDAANQYWCSQQTLIDCSASNGYWYGPGVLCSDPMVECESAPVDGCTSEAGAQCAGRPSYMDQAYLDTFSHGGEIAVMTASPAITGGAVLTVFDLTDTIGAPTNSWFALDRYSHNTWTQATLGSIFGLAIDSDGAIYVSATRSWWMDVMGPAGWGGVYRIDPITGAVSTFAVLPNVISGLGSMTYDCDHNQFFVSNFENGLLYQLDAAGNTVGTFDHGLPFNGVSPAALGDRPFGVEVHAGRLYYSLWNEDQNTYAAATANEIWSVELDATGTPVLGTALLEISIPQFYNNWSSPVSDIRFSTTGSMMLAERSMNGIDGLGAHNARVLEYECVAGVWTPSVNTFNVGSIPQSAAGGVDVTDAMVWASADAMHIGYQDNMYGIQGLPLSGGTTANSVLIDYQDNLTNQDKTLLGDLVVVPGQNVIVACPQLQDLSINCISVPGPDDYELVLGISNMDALATITSVTLSPPSGMTLSPSVFAMNLPGQHSWSVTTVLSGAANGQDVCFDVTIIFDNGAVCEDVLCVDLPNCNIQVPGDLNADFVVDISDLLMLLEAFGADCAEGCDADLNGDGQVGVDDLLILVSNWS